MAPAGELVGLTYRTGGSEVWVTQEKVNRPRGGLLKGVWLQSTLGESSASHTPLSPRDRAWVRSK